MSKEQSTKTVTRKSDAHDNLAKNYSVRAVEIEKKI
jgi:hypothetical protein